jgi:hypothetical protein
MLQQKHKAFALQEDNGTRNLGWFFLKNHPNPLPSADTATVIDTLLVYWSFFFLCGK